MPYRIEWEKSGIHTTWTGLVSSKAVLAFQREIQEDDRFDRLRYSLHDFAGCTAVSAATEEMEEVAYKDLAGASSNKYPIKIAFITANPEVIDLIRLYTQTGASPYPTKIFTDLASARAWAAPQMAWR